MQGLGIARAHAGLVHDDLPEAALPDGAEGLLAGELAVEIDAPGFLGARRGTPGKLVAALGFRLHREPQRDGRGEATRQAEKLGRIASL
jgi:hypothetical protein